MRVMQVKYLSDYKLELIFSDHKQKIVDLSPIVENAKGIYLPLKNVDYFKQVAIDDIGFTISWPNGADLCPDVLYEMGKDR